MVEPDPPEPGESGTDVDHEPDGEREPARSPSDGDEAAASSATVGNAGSATDGRDGEVEETNSSDDDDSTEGDSVETLRERVEEKYDFENFGPADMAEMSADEWEAAFEEDSWLTGQELLDRVAADLRARVAQRDVFARVERHHDPPVVLAYSDESYAKVYPDGTVTGEGSVLRDVESSVVLCAMESYDVPEAPSEEPLPAPAEVPEGGGDLGHTMLQVVAGVQVLGGLALLVGGFLTAGGAIGGSGGNAALVFVAAFGLLVVGILLFAVVANARLSDRFRAEEYRGRLRAVGLGDGERPEFVPPVEDGED